jgi:competence protein ComEC
LKKWAKKRLHISWFIAALCLGIIIGSALCLRMASDIWTSPQWLIVVLSLFIISIIKRPRIFIGLALIAGLLLGCVRGSTVQQQFSAYRPFIGQAISLKGKVVEDASYGKKGDQRLRLGKVVIEGQDLAGEVWISLGTPADIKRGDYVMIRGKLGDGFGNLQATVFRAELQSVNRPHPGDVGRVFRDWFAAGISKAIPEPQSNLGIGYLVGQKTALPEGLEEQIRITGLTHVVVASGYNLMILVVFARRLFSKVSKYLATLAAGTMIAGFMMISGLSPSMSRAGLVAGLGLLAWYYGRRTHPVVLLSFAAAITLLIRPSYIWGDVGWFLSFLSFAGVIILAPLLHNYFWNKNKNPGFMRQLFVTTLSAQILTLPIIMYTFGQYSIYALLANILVLPVVPFAMLFTFVAGLGGVLIPVLASVFGWPAHVLLSYSTFVIEKIANLPNAKGEVEIANLVVFISYLMIALAIFYLWKKTKHNFRAKQAEEATLL